MQINPNFKDVIVGDVIPLSLPCGSTGLQSVTITPAPATLNGKDLFAWVYGNGSVRAVIMGVSGGTTVYYQCVITGANANGFVYPLYK